MNKNNEITPKQEIVNFIVNGLKNGTSPLVKEGAISPEPQMNYETGYAYTGVNRFLLAQAGADISDDPRWLTKGQLSKIGAVVDPNVKPQKLVLWQFNKKVYERDENNNVVLDDKGQKKLITVELEKPEFLFFESYNASQVKGWDGHKLPLFERTVVDNSQRFDDVMETLIINSQAKTIGDARITTPKYNPVKDEIQVPAKYVENAELEKDYYSAVLPVLIKRMIDKEFSHGKSAVNLSPQEIHQRDLLANISALFTAQELNIPYQPNIENNNIQSSAKAWAEFIENNPDEFFQICKTAEYMKEFALDFVIEIDQQKETIIDFPEKLSSETIYLNAAFNEKEEVKALGATWDSDVKMWCARPGTNLTPLQKWLPENQAELKPEQTIEKEVKKYVKLEVPYKERAEAKELGAYWLDNEKSWVSSLENNNLPELEKRWPLQAEKNQEVHVKKVNSEIETSKAAVPEIKKEKTYLYVPFKEKEEAKKCGATWEAETKSWVALPDVDLTPLAKWLPENEKSIDLTSAAAIKENKEILSIVKEDAYSKAAEIAEFKMQNRKDATNEHPILLKNEIPNCCFFQDSDENLIAPVIDLEASINNGAYTPKIQNLLSINHEGKMSLEPGGKRKNGAILIGEKHFSEMAKNPKKEGKIVITDDYVAASTISMCCNHEQAVAVAMGSSNLKSVAKMLREKLPEAQIVICATEKTAENIQGVAKDIKASVVIPTFKKEEKEQGLYSVNDLYRKKGQVAITELIKYNTPNKIQENKTGLSR